MLETLQNFWQLFAGIAFGLVFGYGFAFIIPPQKTIKTFHWQSFTVYLFGYILFFLVMGSAVVDMISPSYTTPLALYVLVSIPVGYIFKQSIPDVISAVINRKK